MRLLDTLERRFGRYAVPNITAVFIACQVLTWFAVQAQLQGVAQAPVIEQLELVPERVLEGEVWRLASFLAIPPITNILFAFFFWYLFYLMGTALEHSWGTFRYNVFLLIGYVATVAAAFAVPGVPATNAFLQGSVFLAFAWLYPEFRLFLFFLVPVPIKYLALLTWVFYFLIFAFGGWSSRLMVLASVANFLLFFGAEIFFRARYGRRRMAAQIGRYRQKEPEYFHRCTVCGVTDRTHPQMDFRYCTQCDGSHGYCSEHLLNHEHVTAARAVANAGE